MSGIYIHIPFCKTRCIYCDFYTRTDMSPKGKYVSALCKEIELRKEYIKGETIKTLYFGGGTPSQLSKGDLERIFEAVYKNFEVAADAEITMEANPDDLSDAYLNAISALPFNRLSIGIQSFHDGELRFLNRRHTAKKAKDAVMQAKQIGFDNISIDLMYGLPNQTMDIWQKNLDEAILLDVQHISSYHLIYEQGTKLYRLFKQGDANPIDEDVSVDMFSVMIDRLAQQGFEHYEISNFARNGLYSIHNSSYWTGAKYLGLGAAAHSFSGTDRAWNVASISKYIEAIDKESPNLEIEISDIYTRYNEFILTGMRTMWGVDLVEMEKRFGTEFRNYCFSNVEKFIAQNFVQHTDSHLKLTREGIFISDGIMSDLMWVD